MAQNTDLAHGGRSAKVEQALVRILTYAIRASKPGSCLQARFAARLPAAAGPARGGSAVLTIILEAPAVDLEEVRLAMDRLEQARQWRVAVYKGLGLTVAKRIIEAHGGRIRVEAGTGTEPNIVLELSLAPPSAARAHE